MSEAIEVSETFNVAHVADIHYNVVLQYSRPERLLESPMQDFQEKDKANRFLNNNRKILPNEIAVLTILFSQFIVLP